MGLDLWFKEDMARMLASIHQTMTNTRAAAGPGQGDAYRQGFEDAIQAMAIAFGVCPPQLGKYEDNGNGYKRLPSAHR